MQNAMVAISASAHAIDALYGEIKCYIEIPAHLLNTWDAKRTPRHRRILETMKRGCKLGRRTNEWPPEFEALYGHRDGLVHPKHRLTPSIPHPGDPTHYVGQEMADYTFEASRKSVGLAFDVVLTALRAPREPLVRWARPLEFWISHVENVRAKWPSHAASHEGPQSQ